MRLVRRVTAVSSVVVALTALLLAGCAGEADGGAPRATAPYLRIVTTVAPLTNIVETIASGRAVVTGLVPGGVDSHTFEPPPSAARALATADVVFVNGLGLEEPVIAMARANLADGAEIVALGEATVEPGEYVFDRDFPAEDGDPNPHLWTHPLFGQRYAEVVRDTLTRRDPDAASQYAAACDAFAAKVAELDAAIRVATATVPVPALLTYHDAYPYFARHYGWTVIGAVQVADFQEPSPRELAALITQVRASGVPAVFGSEVFPSPVLAQIGREAGVRYVDTLRDDELPGRPGNPEHSWLGLMRRNLITMVEALGGDATALHELELS